MPVSALKACAAWSLPAYLAATVNPSAFSAREIEAPIPRLPPVTNATRAISILLCVASSPGSVGRKPRLTFSSASRSNGSDLDVTPGRRLDRFVCPVPELCGRRLRSGRVLLEPAVPVGPPAPWNFLCVGEPRIRFGPEVWIHPVIALAAGSLIDHAGDMAAGAEHEFHIAVQQA